MKTFKTYFAAAAAATLLATTGAAQAAFMPVIDEFWIVRNGSEIFRDSFNGTLPQSETTGANPTYSTSGAAGFLSEDGKLTMDPSLGSGVLIPGTTADLFTGATRRTSISGGGNELNQAASFEVHGLFDLGGSAEPMTPGDAFGIRFTDRTGAQEGDDAIQLSYRMLSDTSITVSLAKLDFVADTVTVLDVGSLVSGSGTPAQIELVLGNGAGSDTIDASFTIFDSGGGVIQSDTLFATIGPDDVTIFNGEDFTRGQFFTTTSVDVPAPEPGSLALIGLGLAGIWRMRRKG
jgi:hypothetical protein